MGFATAHGTKAMQSKCEEQNETFFISAVEKEMVYTDDRCIYTSMREI